MKKLVLWILLLCWTAIGDMETHYVGNEPNGFWIATNWTDGFPINPWQMVVIEKDLIVPQDATIVGLNLEIYNYKQVNNFGDIEIRYNVDLGYDSLLLIAEGGSGRWEYATGNGMVDAIHGGLKIKGIFGSENVDYLFDESCVCGFGHIVGDIDFQGKVDFLDLALLANNWLKE